MRAERPRRGFFRVLPSIDRTVTEVAYESSSGAKQSEGSFWRELDDYFSQCAFIENWPRRGSVNGVPQHESPFDLCLVSMEPTVIVGIDRQGSKVTARHPGLPGFRFVGAKHLLGFIEVRTTLPYHDHANVVWFSPAVDHELHRLDLGGGKASFAVGKSTQLTVAVEGSGLVTSREGN